MLQFYVLSLIHFAAGSTDFHMVNSEENVFGDFVLGRGFDSSTSQLKAVHAFREGAINYDFMPITRTETKCYSYQSAKDVVEKMKVNGNAAINYKMISGSGFVTFDSSKEEIKRNVFFECIIDRTLFTISVNTDDMYSSEEEVLSGVAAPGLLNPLVQAMDSVDDKRKLIGDKHVASISYGRRYEVQLQVSYSKKNDWEAFDAQGKAEIGMGFLKIAAEVNYESQESSQEDSLEMSLSSKSYGFVEGAPIAFPTSVKCSESQSSERESVDIGRRLLQAEGCPIEDQVSIADQMKEIIEANIAAMNAEDEGVDLSAESGLSKKEIFAKIGTAYPLSYTTSTNSQWYPSMMDNDFTREVTKNLEQAWTIFAQFEQFHAELNKMSDSLYANYHLLSGATSLSDTFLNYRQELIVEIMELQTEIKEYTKLHPMIIQASPIYFWTKEMRDDPEEEDKHLTHLTLDHLSQKVYRLLGMEDSDMDDTNPIGDSCVFHGITAEINGEEVKFAGDVVYGDFTVKHVLFDEFGETVSLGYIDNGTRHELVYVKKDCSLLREDTTVWFKSGRYVVKQVGTREHIDGNQVEKEFLSNIRIEIVPASTETEGLSIMVTEKDVEHITLRGEDDHQAVFRVDDSNMLMYLNGYVCGEGFSENEARMVCSYLGYSGLLSFKTEKRLPAKSAWRSALTTLTNLDCPVYAMSMEECTYTVEEDEDFQACDIRSGVELVCTDDIIEANVELQYANGEGCVVTGDGVFYVSDTCNGDEASTIGVDSTIVAGPKCLALFTPGEEVFCTVPEGHGNRISDYCDANVIFVDRFAIISPETVSITGETLDVDHTTSSENLIVTVTFGDFERINNDVGDVARRLDYGQFDCTYKGDMLEITATRTSHSCEISVDGETYGEHYAQVVGIDRGSVHFVVACTPNPTFAPTFGPSVSPTRTPSFAPTATPTAGPSVSPTRIPSYAPTATPTIAPTTRAPTVGPSVSPTREPSASPTASPTSALPTRNPVFAPTATPTNAPTGGAWFASAVGESCTNACISNNLVCTEEGLFNHNDDVDSSADVLQMLARLGSGGDETATLCVDEWISDSDGTIVPFFGSTWCGSSSSSRGIDTFDCDAVAPASVELKRLCYCHAPASPPEYPGWTKILQYGSDPYTPTSSASGDLSTVASQGFAKMSDDDINSIAAVDGYHYYLLTTEDSNLNNHVFVRTTSEFCDTCRAFGWSRDYDVCLTDDFDTCEWLTANGARFDTQGVAGNDCGRWFTDYTTTIGCFARGSTSQRCFSDGDTCGHQMRQDVAMYKRVQAHLH